jgi:hypothetical protein
MSHRWLRHKCVEVLPYSDTLVPSPGDLVLIQPIVKNCNWLRFR